jgi:hypothetical protein
MVAVEDRVREIGRRTPEAGREGVGGLAVEGFERKAGLGLAGDRAP